MMTAGRNSGPAPSDRNPWEATATDEDDLRRKLSLFASYNTTSGNRLSGSGRIILTRPMTFTRPVIVKSPQVTIVQAAQFPLTATTLLDCLFDVRAYNVTLDGIYFYAASAATLCTALVRATYDGTDFLTPTQLTMTRCSAYCDQIFVDDSGGNASYARILDCHQAELNATHGAPIYLNSYGQRARGNSIIDGGGDSITVGATGEACEVAFNDCGGGDITTSASLGFNTIVGNTKTGARTIAGTDQQAANT